jgi:hypothetical protein
MNPSIDELRASLELRSTEELLSILRNRDEEEWRPEVFEIVASILAARGVPTADAFASEPEGGDTVESRPLVTVGHFFSPVEAHAARLALESAGIAAWVADEILGASYGVGVGSRLQVRVEDESSALDVLASSPPFTPELPPELAEPPCPRCGSRSVRPVAEVVDPQSTPSAGLGVSPSRRWRNHCGACGNKWFDESE